MRSVERPRRFVHIAWAAALLVALMANPGSAGSQDEPEITDAAGDDSFFGVTSDINSRYDPADIVASWVGNETDTHISFYIQAAGDIVGGSIGGALEAEYFQYLVHGTVGETEALVVVTVRGSAPTVDLTLGASNASVSGAVLAIEVPKTELGNPLAGDLFTAFYVESSVKLRNTGPMMVSDRAPDADFGLDYVFAAGEAAAGAINATDADADGLNDTWEQDNFGNLTFNATDDPDADGCDNLCEITAGTDPNEADTDGDGTSDGDEITAGTDPLDPSDPAGGGDGTDGADGTPTDNGAATDEHGSDAESAAGDDAPAASEEGLFDTLADNASYLGMSAGLFAGVLVLAIIGLSGRWAL